MPRIGRRSQILVDAHSCSTRQRKAWAKTKLPGVDDGGMVLKAAKLKVEERYKFELTF